MKKQLFVVELVYDFSSEMNQTAAVDYCASVGGSLPVITNKEEAMKLLTQGSNILLLTT